jgi:membrane protease YdiL (CAAX protease family)
MKNLVRTFRLFTPDLYAILFFLVGTPVFALATFLFNGMFGAVIGALVSLVAFSSLDIMTDFFVFQGILGKDFDFGIMKMSVHGQSLLRKGVLVDFLRRMIQYLVISAFCAFHLGREFAAAGTYVGFENLAGIALCLAFGFFFTELIGLSVMRSFVHYSDGILAYMLVSILLVLADFCLVTVIGKAPGMNPWPWAMVLLILAICNAYLSEERILLHFISSRGNREESRFITEDRKKLPVFLLIAFGVDFLMVPVMIIGYNQGKDLSVFLVAQMMYPACGVVMAKIFARDEKKLPVGAYATILIAGVLTMVCCLVKITGIFPDGDATSDPVLQISNLAVIVTSILFFILVCAAGREKRENAGFRFHKAGLSILMLLLFTVLYFGRIAILYGISAMTEGDMSILTDAFARMFATKDGLVIWLMTLINAPLTFIMFLGEEYGWRYFLQPILHDRFGRIGGTFLLGVVWGIWHVGADFYFYSDGTGIQMLVQQIVTCVSLGIFFAYAYIKTNNIWVPVFMHFLNNNLIMVISGDTSLAVMQGNTVTWSMIPLSVIGASVFWVFIFSPVFREKKNAEAAVPQTEAVA